MSPSGPWAPLRQPLFNALWVASVVSNVGTTMNDTAAVWTMATLDGSPTMITLMQTMSSLPLFLLALPAGALADVMDRRKLILAAQIGALVTAAAMTALVLTGMLNGALLLLATFQLGLANAFTTPAWQAMVPGIVGKSLLPGALALNGVGYNIARALGPIVGGVVVAFLGPGPVFALNAVSFIAVIAVISRRAYASEPGSAQQEQMLGAMVAALRYTRHAAPMRAVLGRAALYAFAAVAPIALLPILIRERHWNASNFGLLMGCYGLGAICMALFVLPKWRARFSFDRTLAAATFLSAISTAALAAIPNRAIMGVILLVTGAGWISAFNTLSVASQSAFPNWVRARSSAIYLVATQGALAAGALVWGRLTGLHGSSAALWTAAGWLLVCAFFDRWLPISQVETLDLSPSGHWRGHDLAFEPAPEDGPVLITIDYQIDPANAPAFRTAMRALRSTRMRDGSFRSSLFEDLADPTHFRETFLVGSWAEHLRQHQRATRDDQRIEQAVIAFHRGPEPPVVRHFLMTNLRNF